jgi:hypothetical protein
MLVMTQERQGVMQGSLTRVRSGPVGSGIESTWEIVRDRVAPSFHPHPYMHAGVLPSGWAGRPPSRKKCRLGRSKVRDMGVQLRTPNEVRDRSHQRWSLSVKRQREADS